MSRTTDRPGSRRAESRSESLVVIPARLTSTRLPRKMLLSATGKPLVQHTYEAACRARRPRAVCVAADGPEIADVVRGFGGRVELTSPTAASGTDRVAEVARRHAEIDIFVNVQGDEPEMEGDSIDRVIELLERRPDAPMATLAAPIRARRMLDDPACVKVVFDASGRAIYFSRSPIPYPRQWDDTLLQSEPPIWHLHLGIYAYRRDFLLELAALPPSRLEQTEKLEQLRVLEAGGTILVGVVPRPSQGIDTAEDYQAFVARHRAA